MRQKLKKLEILRGYGAYKNVLVQGNVFTEKKLKIFTLGTPESAQSDYQLTIGFGVRKVRSAVVRNRMKRLLREIVRRNKELLFESCKHAAISHLILMCSSSSLRTTGRPSPSYQEIDEEFHILMKRLVQQQ